MFLKKIDWYIIKKVLSTFLLSILMIISIAIVIDITEKMDDFYSEQLSLQTIVFDYYVHFVPYYINLFTPLFTFISVIFVTSKLAFNSEIIAMLAGGISLRRLLIPYFVAAGVIALFSLYIGSYVIPRGNDKRLDFELRYIDHDPQESTLENVQLKVNASETAFMESYNINDSVGTRFSLDRFEGKHLVSRLTANTIRCDSTRHWVAYKYMRRTFVGMREEVERGDTLELELDMLPTDFITIAYHHERLTNPELRAYIAQQSARGRAGLNAYKLEYQKHFASPFGAFILTLIGVCVACRKSRGGTGFHVFIGIALGATYILCTLLSSSFTTQAGWNPALAIWIPNFIYLGIGCWLYKNAPK